MYRQGALKAKEPGGKGGCLKGIYRTKYKDLRYLRISSAGIYTTRRKEWMGCFKNVYKKGYTAGNMKTLNALGFRQPDYIPIKSFVQITFHILLFI